MDSATQHLFSEGGCQDVLFPVWIYTNILLDQLISSGIMVVWRQNSDRGMEKLF